MVKRSFNTEYFQVVLLAEIQASQTMVEYHIEMEKNKSDKS